LRIGTGNLRPPVPFVRFVTPSPLGSHPRRHKMQPLQHAHLRCPPRRIRRRAPQNVIKRSTLGSCADPSKISVGKSSTSFRESRMENSMPCQIGHAIYRPCFGLLRNHKHSIWYPSVRNVIHTILVHRISRYLLSTAGPSLGAVGRHQNVRANVQPFRSQDPLPDRRGAWVWPVSRLLSNSTTPRQRPDRQAKPRRGN